MESKEKKRTFSEKLNYILDQNNFPPKNMGRISLLAEMFSMSHKGAGNWLNAQAIPPSKKIEEICNKFNISKEWLIFGKESLTQSSVIKIPVVTKTEIMEGKITDRNRETSTQNYIEVQNSNSQKSFAVDLETEEFEVSFILSKKAKLIFDPEKHPADKLFALVRLDENIHINRLIEYEKHLFAIKKDSSPNIIPIDDESSIIAVLSEIKF